jgi:hypothetical protein
MKITKEQTALIVVGVAGVIGLLVAVNAAVAHPIVALLLGLAIVGIVVGVVMYQRNKGV